VGKEDWQMDGDCDICSDQSWWDWLEDEPGLYGTIWFTVLIFSAALYLLISADGG